MFLFFFLGAGVFVTTVVAGSIAVTRPFKLAERPFLRDVIFYIAAAFWTFTILYRQKIVLAEAIGMWAFWIWTRFRHVSPVSLCSYLSGL